MFTKLVILLEWIWGEGKGPHVSPVTSVYNNNTYQPRLDFFLSRFPIDVLAGVPRKRIQILSILKIYLGLVHIFLVQPLLYR
jgi:hypothetical protein